MDIAKVLQQLRSELANIDAAIESLERLQPVSRRPGRSRTWVGEDVSPLKPGVDGPPAERRAMRRSAPAADAS
jgi:hypothetical protein